MLLVAPYLAFLQHMVLGNISDLIDYLPGPSVNQLMDRRSFYSSTLSQISPNCFQKLELTVDNHNLRAVDGFVGHFALISARPFAFLFWKTFPQNTDKTHQNYYKKALDTH